MHRLLRSGERLRPSEQIGLRHPHAQPAQRNQLFFRLDTFRHELASTSREDAISAVASALCPGSRSMPWVRLMSSLMVSNNWRLRRGWHEGPRRSFLLLGYRSYVSYAATAIAAEQTDE